MSHEDTTRRTILRGIAAATAVGGVTGTASAGPASVRQVERSVADPASVLERGASQTVAALVERGLLTEGVSDLTTSSRPTEAVLGGADGVAAFSLEPDSGGRTRRYLVASHTTEAGQLRVWLNQTTGHSYATLKTGGSWSKIASSGTSRDVSQQVLCGDVCDDAGCDGRGRYYHFEEYDGQCEVIDSYCGC